MDSFTKKILLHLKAALFLLPQDGECYTDIHDLYLYVKDESAQIQNLLSKQTDICSETINRCNNMTAHVKELESHLEELESLFQ